MEFGDKEERVLDLLRREDRRRLDHKTLGIAELADKRVGLGRGDLTEAHDEEKPRNDAHGQPPC